MIDHLTARVRTETPAIYREDNTIERGATEGQLQRLKAEGVLAGVGDVEKPVHEGCISLCFIRGSSRA